MLMMMMIMMMMVMITSPKLVDYPCFDLFFGAAKEPIARSWRNSDDEDVVSMTKDTDEKVQVEQR